MDVRPALRDRLMARATVLAVVLALMWIVFAIDAMRHRMISVAGIGIVPRTREGLYGIPVAPFIHANFGHIIANTVPFAVLGAVILLGGIADFLFVFITSALVAGVGTWIFGASNTQHVGASGVILGFIGFLLARSLFDRKLSSILITLAVAAFYATALASSLVPREHVSWTAHFFGFAGGIIAARLRHETEV